MAALIGLTGGIAAGKSTVADVFAQLGARVIDADRVARDVVEPGTPGLEAIREAFGDGVIRADGALDRAALGRIVFADADTRRRLEAIVHPRVQAEVARRIEQAPEEAAVVYDVPLLVEAAVDQPFGGIVTVSAPAETRVRRLVTQRGMDEADARARVAAQASEEERLARADYVVDASGSLADTRRRAREVWAQIAAQLF